MHLLCEKKLADMMELMELYWKYDKKSFVRETSYDGANAIGTSFKLSVKQFMTSTYFLNRDCAYPTKISIKFGPF